MRTSTPVVLLLLGAALGLACSPVPDGYPQLHGDYYGGLIIYLNPGHKTTIIDYYGFEPDPSVPTTLCLTIEGYVDDEDDTYVGDFTITIPSAEIRSYTLAELTTALGGDFPLSFGHGWCSWSNMVPIDGTDPAFTMSVDGDDGTYI